MKTINILLVEDNTSDARLIKEMLREISHFKSNLISGTTLKDGCEQIQKNNFDIILLDLNLPDSTGQHTFQKIIDCSKELPVILITGNEDEELSLKLIMEGAQDYITKQHLNPDLLGKSILYSIERQTLLRNIKIQNVQINRIEKELTLLAKFPAENPDPVLRVDQNGKLLYANEASYKFLSWKLQIGKKISSALRNIIAEALKEGVIKIVDSEHNQRFISFNIVPVVEEGYANLYGRDITARKQTEKKLKEANIKLIRAQRIANVGSWNNYLPTNQLDWSEEMYHILGFPLDTPMSLEKIIGVFPPEELERFRIAVDQAINGNVPYNMDYKIRRPDGGVRYIHDQGEVVRDKKGKAIWMIGTTRDITERKKAEAELIASKEKAEESDRLKSAFLANMSHEIRTPMNGILGFAELLKEPKLTGEEQQVYISIIEKSGARMLNIINDIINISKVESGQMEISITETNVNEQIEFIYTFFKPEAELKGIRISFKNPLTAKEATINTDREKIYAIFTNLVKNAIKFTHAGSIELGYKKKGKYLEFFVKDSGIGIRQEQKEIIFRRFRQGSEMLTRNYEGAGLGLSISKAYVELLGGKIWAESEPGKGSAFYFTIPCNIAPEEKNVNKDIDSPDGAENPLKNLKILIAEDDETSGMLIDMAVKIFSKEIKTVKTGIEAVEACRNNPDIDVVLMDIKMPEMDGYEATRQIRQFNKDVIIIAQTAFGLVNDREKAIEAGCDGYLPKPFNKDSLPALLINILKNKKKENKEMNKQYSS